MQLELDARGGAPARRSTPRVLALCVPDLALQRVLRAREAGPPEGRAPVAVERDGRVVACDAEARARGIRRGDALVQARAFCADLFVVPASEGEDRAALEGLAEALLGVAPTVEVAHPDTVLLDASGAHLFASEGRSGESALLERALAVAGELGLRARAAIASGRAPARALARHAAVPAAVPPAATEAALSELPITALELPEPLEARLAALGLTDVGALAQLPAKTLGHRLGQAALEAWHLARGDDPSPLVPYRPERLPGERLDPEGPVESSEGLLFGLNRICDRLAARLAGRGLGASRLALVLELDPTGEERLDIALAIPSCSASRWMLVLRERLRALRLEGAVRAAALEVSEAAPTTSEQLALGDRPERLAALETVLARLAARLGREALFAAERVDRHRPEAAYRAGAFQGGLRRPPPGAAPDRSPGRGPRRHGATSTCGSGEAASDGGAGADAMAAFPRDAPVRPTRLLDRPQPIIALGEGGRLTAVRIDGTTRRVLALSPAERLAGEWWCDPFDRDYHRARVEGLGDCWIFRDALDGRLWLHGFFD